MESILSQVNVGLLIQGAIIIVGLIETLKRAIDKGAMPQWVYPVLIPVIGVGVGFSSLIPALFSGLTMAAGAQLGYPILVGLPKALLEKLSGNRARITTYSDQSKEG